MVTITIPKELIKMEDFILLPLKKYKELLYGTKAKKIYSQLDMDLDAGIKDYKIGKTVGPFSSVKELKKSLEK